MSIASFGKDDFGSCSIDSDVQSSAEICYNCGHLLYSSLSGEASAIVYNYQYCQRDFGVQYVIFCGDNTATSNPSDASETTEIDTHVTETSFEVSDTFFTTGPFETFVTESSQPLSTEAISESSTTLESSQQPSTEISLEPSTTLESSSQTLTTFAQPSCEAVQSDMCNDICSDVINNQLYPIHKSATLAETSCAPFPYSVVAELQNCYRCGVLYTTFSEQYFDNFYYYINGCEYNFQSGDIGFCQETATQSTEVFGTSTTDADISEATITSEPFSQISQPPCEAVESAMCSDICNDVVNEVFVIYDSATAAQTTCAQLPYSISAELQNCYRCVALYQPNFSSISSLMFVLIAECNYEFETGNIEFCQNTAQPTEVLATTTDNEVHTETPTPTPPSITCNQLPVNEYCPSICNDALDIAMNSNANGSCPSLTSDDIGLIEACLQCGRAYNEYSIYYEDITGILYACLGHSIFDYPICS